MKIAMEAGTIKAARTRVRHSRTRKARETLAETQARVDAVFEPLRKRFRGDKAAWDALEAALAEGKRERIAAVRRMAERWRWNERGKRWEKGPA